MFKNVCLVFHSGFVVLEHQIDLTLLWTVRNWIHDPHWKLINYLCINILAVLCRSGKFAPIKSQNRATNFQFGQIIFRIGGKFTASFCVVEHLCRLRYNSPDARKSRTWEPLQKAPWRIFSNYVKAKCTEHLKEKFGRDSEI